MKELTIEEKIAEIKNTNSYQDVKNSWFPPYHEKEYYFVSYFHKDYKLVYESLHRLQSGEKRLNLWYDHNLTPGRDWEIEARRYIYDFNCKGVIFFLSENAVLSQSIHKEIEFVKNSGKSYLSINLPCEKIEGHAGEYLSAVQMLELLKQQGYEIENYDEKSAVLNETFNSKITYLPFNEDIDSQIDKILSLKRQPLLNIEGETVISINDINVMEIKKEDFEYFDKRNERVIATKIGPCAFANCHNLEKIEIPSCLTELYDYAFYNCKKLKNIILPDDVVTIGRGAFFNCENLTYITIPSGVKTICDLTFFKCTNLSSVNLSNVTLIGNRAFEYCQNLTDIVFPSYVEKIGNSAFHYCKKLKNLKLPSSIDFIGEHAFCNCESFTKIILPSNLTGISEGMFSGCINLEKIVLPQNLSYIDQEAFINCSSLTKIIIPESVEKIGESVFMWCSNLSEIILPKGIKGIYNYTFAHCGELKNIKIPNSVIIVGEYAFEDCCKLNALYVPDNIHMIADFAFCRCKNLKEIYIPISLTEIGNEYDECNSVTDIYYSGTKQQWISIDKYDLWDGDMPNYTVHCTDGNLKKGEF